MILNNLIAGVTYLQNLAVLVLTDTALACTVQVRTAHSVLPRAVLA